MNTTVRQKFLALEPLACTCIRKIALTKHTCRENIVAAGFIGGKKDLSSLSAIAHLNVSLNSIHVAVKKFTLTVAVDHACNLTHPAHAPRKSEGAITAVLTVECDCASGLEC